MSATYDNIESGANDNEQHWSVNVGKDSGLSVLSDADLCRMPDGVSLPALRRHFGPWLAERFNGPSEPGRVRYQKTSPSPRPTVAAALRKAPPAIAIDTLEAAMQRAKASGDWPRIQGALFPNPAKYPGAYQVSGDSLFILHGVASKQYIPGAASDDQIPLSALIPRLRAMRTRADMQSRRLKIITCVFALAALLAVLTAAFLVYQNYENSRDTFAGDLSLAKQKHADFQANKRDGYVAAADAVKRLQATDYGFFFNSTRDKQAQPLAAELDAYQREIGENGSKLEEYHKLIRDSLQASETDRQLLAARLDDYSKCLKDYNDKEYDSGSRTRAADQYDKLFQAGEAPEIDAETRDVLIKSWFKNARETLGDSYYNSARLSFEAMQAANAAQSRRQIKNRIDATLKKIQAFPAQVDNKALMGERLKLLRGIVKEANFDILPDSIDAAVREKETEIGAALTASLVKTIQDFSPKIFDRLELDKECLGLKNSIIDRNGREPLPAGVEQSLTVAYNRLFDKLVAATVKTIQEIPVNVSSRAEMNKQIQRMRALVQNANFVDVPSRVKDALGRKESEFADGLNASLEKTIQGYAPGIFDNKDLVNKLLELEEIVKNANNPEPLPPNVTQALKQKKNDLASALMTSVQDRIKAFSTKVTNISQYKERLNLLESIAGPNPSDDAKLLAGNKKDELRNSLLTSLRDRLAHFQKTAENKDEYNEKDKLLKALAAEIRDIQAPEDLSIALRSAGQSLAQALADSIARRMDSLPVGMSQRTDIFQKMNELDAILSEIPPGADSQAAQDAYERKKRGIQASANLLYKDLVTRMLQSKLEATDGLVLKWQTLDEILSAISDFQADPVLTDTQTKKELRACSDYMNELKKSYFSLELKQIRVELKLETRRTIGTLWLKEQKFLPWVSITIEAGDYKRVIYKSGWLEPEYKKDNVNLEGRYSTVFGVLPLKGQLHLKSGQMLHVGIVERETQGQRIGAQLSGQSMTPAGLGHYIWPIETKDPERSGVKIFSFSIAFEKTRELVEFYKIGLSYEDMKAAASRIGRLREYSAKAEKKAKSVSVRS